MTVKDYFCKSDFEKVLPYLLKRGEKSESRISDFRFTFENVRVYDYFTEPSDGRKVYIMQSSEDNTSPYLYVHPATLLDKPWIEIFRREVVVDEGIKPDSIEHVTALLIWEMTFYGYPSSAPFNLGEVAFKHKKVVFGMPYYEITEELMQRKFHEYSKLYFEGKLKQCVIKFGAIRDIYNSLGLYYSKKAAKQHYESNVPVIIIDNLITYDYDYKIRSILLHEMIHMYFDVVLNDSKENHGKKFQRMRRELNKKYNLHIQQRGDWQCLQYNIHELEVEINI